MLVPIREAGGKVPALTDSFPQQVHVTYPYPSVMTFGGCRDDFMLVIRSNPDQSSGKSHIEKLIFRMAAPKVGLMALKTIYPDLVRSGINAYEKEKKLG